MPKKQVQSSLVPVMFVAVGAMLVVFVLLLLGSRADLQTQVRKYVTPAPSSPDEICVERLNKCRDKASDDADACWAEYEEYENSGLIFSDGSGNCYGPDGVTYPCGAADWVEDYPYHPCYINFDHAAAVCNAAYRRCLRWERFKVSPQATV